MKKALIALMCAGCLSLPTTHACAYRNDTRWRGEEERVNEERFQELERHQHEIERRIEDNERDRRFNDEMNQISESYRRHSSDSYGY